MPPKVKKKYSLKKQKQNCLQDARQQRMYPNVWQDVKKIMKRKVLFCLVRQIVKKKKMTIDFILSRIAKLLANKCCELTLIVSEVF